MVVRDEPAPLGRVAGVVNLSPGHVPVQADGSPSGAGEVLDGGVLQTCIEGHNPPLHKRCSELPQPGGYANEVHGPRGVFRGEPERATAAGRGLTRRMRVATLVGSDGAPGGAGQRGP